MTTVAIVPAQEALARAASEAGARVVAPEDADALVWTNPRDPQGLKELLARSPARWVQLPFAGIESFFAAGVIDPARTWTCAKGIYGPASAELALALILAAARRIDVHARERRWWSYREAQTLRRVAGTTAAIIGTGGIGRALARMLEPLDVRVLAANRSGAPMPRAERTVRVDELGLILPEADWVVVAAALTPATTGLLDAAMFARMRRDAWVVNVARGGLVRTDDLLAALRAGTIGGAALDVTDPEPLPDDHPLWDEPNVIVTSHTANTTAMAIPELAAMIGRNVRAWIAGEPLEGLVDPALGY